MIHKKSQRANSIIFQVLLLRQTNCTSTTMNSYYTQWKPCPQTTCDAVDHPPQPWWIFEAPSYPVCLRLFDPLLVRAIGSMQRMRASCSWSVFFAKSLCVTWGHYSLHLSFFSASHTKSDQQAGPRKQQTSIEPATSQKRCPTCPDRRPAAIKQAATTNALTNAHAGSVEQWPDVEWKWSASS